LPSGHFQKKINGFRIEFRAIDSRGSKAFEIPPEASIQFPYQVTYKIQECLMNDREIIRCQIHQLNGAMKHEKCFGELTSQELDRRTVKYQLASIQSPVAGRYYRSAFRSSLGARRFPCL
jgi:hypothetical protein